MIILTSTVIADHKALESQVKAAFLERFTRFVTYPERTNIYNIDEPFQIILLGENSFGKTLEEVYRKQKILNKPVSIKYAKKLSELDSANLVFISQSYSGKLEDVINYLADKPILTVSDTKGYCERGVMINLLILDNNLSFEINEKTVSKSSLKMSHLLLQKAARLVK